jgi:hypothetical protein
MQLILQARPHPACHYLTPQAAGCRALTTKSLNQKGKILARENFAFLPKKEHPANGLS